MREPGPGRLPLLDRLAARAARRARARGTQPGFDFYDRLIDGLLEARHRSPTSRCTTGTCRRRCRTQGGWLNRDTAPRFADYADDVAAALRRPRRSRSPRTTSRGASATLGHEQRQVRARHQATAQAAIQVVAPPAAGARRRRCRRMRAARRAAPLGIVLNQRAAVPGHRQRGGPRARRGCDDGLLDALVHGPALPRPLPGRRARAPGRRRAARCSDGDLAADRAAARLPRRQLLHRAASSATEHAAGAARRARWASPTWAGRSTRRASPSCWCGCTRDYAPAADLHHRERRGLRRRARSRRPRARRAAHRLPARATSRAVARRDRRRASTCAATSSGPCSTTSSGPPATSKRFGIVHVDYATQQRTPKDSALLVPRLHRRAGTRQAVARHETDVDDHGNGQPRRHREVLRQRPDGRPRHRPRRSRDGEFIVFVGPSGCGKSTLLRMIAGLEDITAGELADRRPARQRRAAGQARRRDGVPELRALPAHDGGREHGLRAASWRARPKAEIDAAVGTRGRDPAASRTLLRRASRRQLSGGQRQRVAIGRAIVRKPRGVPVRRAAVQPRRRAARADARRAGAAAPRARHDDGLRDARPGRGDDAGRPHRGVQRRPHRAGRRAARRCTTGRPTASSPASSARRG